MSAKSLTDLFEKSVEAYSDNILLWEKRNAHYKGVTYAQAHERVLAYAAGLMKAGLEKGDRVALIAEGRNDWVISELAILYCGAVSVPLSVKIEEDLDLQFRLSHPSCKGIVISENHQHKAFRLAGQLPDLEFMVLLDGLPTEADEETYSVFKDITFDKSRIYDVEELVRQGTGLLKEKPDAVSQVAENLKPGDYANICYTSGTTADPKGIILTHNNYLCNVEQASSIFEVPEYYTSLHILPWDHSFAHTVGIYALIRNGASLASLKLGKTLNETIRNIPVCIKEVRPYFLLSVPALAKNFKNNIEKAITEKGKMTQWLFNTAMKTAIVYNRDGHNRGSGLRFMLKPFYALFDKIIFSKIRENFGGRLKFFVGGGALLDIELQRFFYAIGLPMYQGYGLTEAAPVISSNTPDFHKLGSSGKVVPHLELMICDEDGKTLAVGEKGEIVVKGENVMAGYWNNESATRETIREGWLYTGDIGYLDKDGYLYVLGRNKSLLISSDGEKYSPEGIEETMVQNSPFIDQVMLYNNQHPYTTALIYPNKKSLQQWAEKNNFDLLSEDGSKAALLKLQTEIDRFLPGGDLDKLFPPRWLPTATFVLKEPFSEQNKMINSTMKMVRPAILQRFSNDLEFLYTPEGKDICHSRNMESIPQIFAANGKS